MTCARCAVAERAVEGRRAREGDYVACVRGELARWRRWQEHAGQRGAGKEREGDITRTGHAGQRVARAKVLSLQTWQSSRKSQNPPTISRSTSPRHGKTASLCVHVYSVHACVSVCETAARYTQASPRASGGSRCLFERVRSADEDFNARARACVLIG